MTKVAPNSPQYMVPVSQEGYIAKRWSDQLINIGVYKSPERTSGGETVEDTYANYKGKKIKNGNILNVKFDLHELRPDIIDILENGAVKYEQETASITDRVEEYLPGSWSFTKDIILKSRNSDKTAVTVSEVKALIDGTRTVLTVSTDYTIGVTIFGDTYIKLIQKTTTGVLEEGTPSTASISVKYSATPDPTLKKMEHFSSAIPAGFVMVLEEKWSYNGEELGIRVKLENCQNVKSFAKGVSDDDGTTSAYPCEISGTVVGHEYFGFSD